VNMLRRLHALCFSDCTLQQAELVTNIYTFLIYVVFIMMIYMHELTFYYNVERLLE